MPKPLTRAARPPRLKSTLLTCLTLLALSPMVAGEVPRRGASGGAPSIPEPAEGRVRGDHEHARKPTEMAAGAKPAEFVRGDFGRDGLFPGNSPIPPSQRT